MKFWVEKEINELPADGWNRAFRLDIKRDKASTISSSLPKTWYHLGQMEMPAIYEDLFIIGLTVFALDKRVSRRLFEDCWTRYFEVSIPVLQYNVLSPTEQKWNQLLSFLTGDEWKIHFRKTKTILSKHKHKNRKQIDISKCDCVSLFSGGLDSYCGAIHLLEKGKSPCLIGHNEYPKLRYIQEGFCRDFNECYPNQETTFIGFTAGAYAPQNNSGEVLANGENTSRGRSLLFLCAAVTIAGILGEDVPVFIPENGFIGLNVALTAGRKGSCSTRTTHPYFISRFKEILLQIGIQNRIENFFAYMTKREIVKNVVNTEVFRRGYLKTISCSHPCQPRYNRVGSRKYPRNCGFCYPCLIRKSSLLDVDEDTNYVEEISPSRFLALFSESERSNDLNAVVSSIYRFKHSDKKQIRQMVKSTGPLTSEEIDRFERVYTDGMNDLIELMQRDDGMKGYYE